MKLTGGATWSAGERRARDAAAVAARWGEQGAGPACQSKVGSALGELGRACAGGCWLAGGSGGATQGGAGLSVSER
jgi:hypothetical protein